MLAWDMPVRINVAMAGARGGITISLRRLLRVICHLYDTAIHQRLIFRSTLSDSDFTFYGPLSLTYLYINLRL